MMGLQMKEQCERCGTALPMESAAACICSHECTFCQTCSEGTNNICPNCGGELVPRPRRVKRE
jgi:hypothetical protein